MELTHEQIIAAEGPAHQRRMEAAARAQGIPLPGALKAAFAGKPPSLGNLKFRDVCLDDFTILAELDHPLQHLVTDILSGKVTEPSLSLQHLKEALFLWTRPFEVCEEHLAKGDFSAAARRLRTGLPLSDLPKITEAIVANLGRAFSTMMAFGPAAQEGEGQSFPAGQPAMGSAGGSNSGAH